MCFMFTLAWRSTGELEEKMIEPILNELKADKKNENGVLNFTLIDGIGESSINHFLGEKEVKDSLIFYFNL